MGACGKLALIILCIILALPALIFGAMVLLAMKGAGISPIAAVFAAGCFAVVFTSLLGIWGASAESRCTLIVFIAFISIGMVLCFVAGVFLVTAGNKKQPFKETITQVTDAYVKEQIEYLVPEGKCCDCRYKPGVIPTCPPGEKMPDCCVMVERVWINGILLFGSVAISLALFQIACVVLACVLCHEFARQQDSFVFPPPGHIPPTPGKPPPSGTLQRAGVPLTPGTQPAPGTQPTSGTPPTSGMPPRPGMPMTSPARDGSRKMAVPVGRGRGHMHQPR